MGVLTKRNILTLPGLAVLIQPEETLALETGVEERCYIAIGLKVCEGVKLNCYRIFSVWWAVINKLTNLLGP